MTYDGRIDDGFSSSTINGLGSLCAAGGTAGNAAYLIALVHLPDSAIIVVFSAQLIKNGSSLQSTAKLLRPDATGYSSNTAQLIATAPTTSSGV